MKHFCYKGIRLAADRSVVSTVTSLREGPGLCQWVVWFPPIIQRTCWGIGKATLSSGVSVSVNCGLSTCVSTEIDWKPVSTMDVPCVSPDVSWDKTPAQNDTDKQIDKGWMDGWSYRTTKQTVK